MGSSSYLSYLFMGLGLTAGLVVGYVSRIIYRKIEIYAYNGFSHSLSANTAVILSNIFATLVSTVFILLGFISALFVPIQKGSFFSNAFLVGAIVGIWIYRYLISRQKS
jgi:hypothetical protein